jgi:thioredoxin-like negative regulator of GroEL
MIRIILPLLAFLVISPVHSAVRIEADMAHTETRPFDETANAQADVDAALLRAKANASLVLIVMGANWCHDSTGLADLFATPRFAAMLKERYELVYVDVGAPQMGEGRNLDIAKRFGIKKIKGTPTVMIVSADGELLNKKDAPTWRNAASRNADDVFRAFAEFTAP